MAKPLRFDRTLFLVTLVLAAFGIVMVFSSSAVMATERFGDPNFFSFKQVVTALLGMAAMFALMRVDYHRYNHSAVVFTVLSVVIALLVAVFFFAATAKTYRWISLPGFSLQPSEMAKLALVLFLAYFLDKRRDSLTRLSTLLPVGLIAGALTLAIVLEPDFGTAVSLVVIVCVLLIVAGIELRWIGLASMFGVPLAMLVFYVEVYRVDWRWQRIEAFLNPWADPRGKGWQLTNSLISVGTGGITGLGYMEGKQKLFFLPEAHTDFIFSIIAEELGMLGALAVLTLFGIFLWRGIRAAMRAPDLFGSYLALGITMMIVVQAFINMSVATGLLPTKGIPLPFLSYGGSSIVVMLASVGILLNVSQQGS